MPARQLSPKFVERVWGVPVLKRWRIGEVWFEADSPLLVKYIYTADRLSIQVHPGGPTGKTELWHVIEAAPGAVVGVGLKEPVARDRFLDACRSGEVERMVAWKPVAAGDSVFIPAGTVHAIGAGVSIVEIQQNNDVTYRLYDYGRPRELHLEQGVAVSTLGPHPGVTRIMEGTLARCDYFVADRVTIERDTPVADGFFIALEGEGAMDGAPLKPGSVWRIEGGAIVSGTVTAITARVP